MTINVLRGALFLSITIPNIMKASVSQTTKRDRFLATETVVYERPAGTNVTQTTETVFSTLDYLPRRTFINNWGRISVYLLLRGEDHRHERNIMTMR
jgi:hypothetical protein